MGEASIIDLVGLDCCEDDVVMCRVEGIVSSWEQSFLIFSVCYGVFFWSDSVPISVSCPWRLPAAKWSGRCRAGCSAVQSLLATTGSIKYLKGRRKVAVMSIDCVDCGAYRKMVESWCLG